MPSVKVAVRTQLRLVKVDIDDGKDVRALKAEVAKDIGVDAKLLTISLTASGDPPLPDASAIADLGIAGKLVHGVLPKSVDLVKPDPPKAAEAPAASAGAAAGGAGAAAVGGAGAASSSPAGSSAGAGPMSPGTGGAGAGSVPTRTRPVLTPRCGHGPNGACPHCLPASEEDFDKKREEPLNKAVAFNARAAEKSKATTGGEAGEMEWLCRHRPDQMCLNCAPLHKGEKVELEMLCQHAPEARCINCLPPDTKVEGRKHVSYGEMIEEAKSRCSHPFAATCVHCAGPSERRYKLKPGCTKHAPWPRGICLECQPETVDLSPQPYRHVDRLLINCAGDLHSFINAVSANAGSNFQRAGILYGRYAPDPNFRAGVQAVVEAIYEPPQVVDFATGAVRLLADPHAGIAEAVAAACGLQAVGWVFSRKHTQKSHGVALLPHELFAIAAQQLAHSPRATDGRPGSQWVTLTVHKDPADGQYHLQGYMGSDQLVAMVRDGALSRPKPADTKFKKRELKKGPDGIALPGEEPVPDILAKREARGAYRVDEFDPDVGIVQLEATAPVPGTPLALAFPPMFAHEGDFPAENREALAQVQSDGALKAMMRRYATEPDQRKIADFHALVYVGKRVDPSIAVSAAKSVATGTPLDEGTKLLIDEVVA